VPRLSILIPVADKLERLEDTLISLLENRPADCQIVVVLNEPYADPYQLKDEVCFIEAPRRARLAESINFGFASCRAPIVHVLACGLEVSPGWTDPVLAHFKDPKVAAVAPLVLKRGVENEIISTGVRYRPGGAASRLRFGRSPEKRAPNKGEFFGADILAAFYRRSAWDAAGGLNTSIGGHLCGVDLALALHFAGYLCASEDNCRIFGDPADALGAGRLGRGWSAERLFWTWASDMGWKRALAGHAVLLTSECLTSIVRPSTIIDLCGRALQTLRFAAHKPKRRAAVHPASPYAHDISPPHFAVKQSRRSATCADR
jgi:hypothetical protein